MPTPHLPSPRQPGHYSIALVCLGNICRSPMADVVLSDHVARAGLADRVRVSSSGTGGWHVGNPMDDRAAATLTASGYDATQHRAQQWRASDHGAVDLVLTMDAANLRDVGPGSSEEPRARLFRDFDPAGPGDVPDPYYGGDAGFHDVLTMVERTAAALTTALVDLLPPAPPTADRSP